LSLKTIKYDSPYLILYTDMLTNTDTNQSMLCIVIFVYLQKKICYMTCILKIYENFILKKKERTQKNLTQTKIFQRLFFIFFGFCVRTIFQTDRRKEGELVEEIL
jgi:hypothetical protein